ncbi:MAG TPA: DUF4199 domain-containing protein [Ohtaekwangia sp.]
MRQFLDRYPNRIPEIYGSFIALALIVYFLISYWVGFVHIVELRLLNFPILVTGVYFALKHFERTHDGSLNYFRGLVTGIATASIGTLTFVVFLYAIFMIDKDLFQSVVKDGPMGAYQNVYLATFAVGIEGVFSGFMATFILMNFIDTAKT